MMFSSKGLTPCTDAFMMSPSMKKYIEGSTVNDRPEHHFRRIDTPAAMAQLGIDVNSKDVPGNLIMNMLHDSPNQRYSANDCIAKLKQFMNQNSIAITDDPPKANSLASKAPKCLE